MFMCSLSDMEAYRQLHGASTGHNSAIPPWFICEGRFLVEDAINATKQGRLQIISILCDSKQAEEWESKIPPDVRLLTLDSDELNELVGFQFHRGTLCCCAVPDSPGVDMVAQSMSLLVLPQIDNVDNLGQLSRTAAALGIDAMILGKGPNLFSRRCVRTSMGAVWKIPILRTENIEQVLDAWIENSPGLKSEIVGTADTPDAESVLQWQPAQRTALVLGSESRGVDSYWHHKCTKHVRIPMAEQMDSLNVSAAGAILMGKLVI